MVGGRLCPWRPVLNVLEQEYKSGTPTAPVYVSATKHSDGIYVSRYYNWHSGSWKGVYTRVAEYKLKPDAPNDTVEMLSKNLFVPMLEKLLGAALSAAAGMLYVAQVLPRPLAPAVKMNRILTIAGPTFLIASLFLANWLKHDDLHGHP